MTTKNLRPHVVILAGGQGTRFWPMSRMRRPKQFLSIEGSGESLIQATVRRILPLVAEGQVWIATGKLHVPLIREQVPDARLIIEPVARNTAASIALSALRLVQENPEAVMIVLPADHAVSNEERLRETLRRAIHFAEQNDSLLTIGIPPLTPNTAYGYILRGKSVQDGIYSVDRFFEKPSLARAQEYVESGDFYWNSGMFVWKAKVFLAEVERLMPELYAGLQRIAKTLGKANEQDVLEEVFPTLPSISVDFGILEHARNVAVVHALEYGWNDVGSWDAWAEHFGKDVSGNLLHGDACAIDSTDCVVSAHNRFIAVVGAKDLVVIDTGDALLVCPRDKVQDVKKVVSELVNQGRTELT